MSEAKHTPEDKLFNYLCEIGATPIDTEIHEVRIIVYEELGLSGIENPREWVKLMKGHKEITGFQTPAEFNAYEKGRNDEEKVMVKFIGDWQPNETNSVIGQLLADKNNKLQAELEEYKTMESLHKSSSHDIRMLTNENLKLKDTIVRGDRIMVENAHEITKLQAELKQAAEAWDKGFMSGKNYVESSMSCDEGVRLPENPYK